MNKNLPVLYQELVAVHFTAHQSAILILTRILSKMPNLERKNENCRCPEERQCFDSNSS
jgi:hypothetical protein